MHRNVICEAIQNGSVLEFSYKGRHRAIEPHLLGIDGDGDLTLSAWQLSGGSGEGWRDFHVSKMSGLSTTGLSFSGPRRGYNPNDSTLDQILCRI